MVEVEQRYRYKTASTLDAKRSALNLATSGGRALATPSDNPRFFEGFFTRPEIAAEGLRAVAQVAGDRYTDLARQSSRGRASGNTMRDPVVTSNGRQLRFESLSACCGVYARLDVLPEGIDGDIRDRGTTNVDINEPLRRMLAVVAPKSLLHVSVGADDLTISEPDRTIVERKVPLPERWLRGFAESQHIASAFDAKLELAPAEASRFLRAAADKAMSGWVLPAGRTARFAGRPSSQAVFLGDARRLAALIPLLRFATAVRAYGPNPTSDTASSAWELDLPGLRLVLMVSPAPTRGFSGEGSLLDQLSRDEALDDADLVRAAIEFQPDLDVTDLAATVGIDRDRVNTALACLATAGQVGYDLSEAEYFHRELPYDADALAKMNPRLGTAHALVDSDAVRIVDDAIAEVTSGDNTYRVRRTVTGVNCTCTWWTSHRGGRGPCKHVLAAQIVRNRASGGGAPDDVELAGLADNSAAH